MDYFQSKQTFTVASGDLLISAPYLSDSNFERTVIFVCEHGKNGSMGYVLNKPSTLHFNEVIEVSESFDALVYIGGPVQQNTLHFLHRASHQMNAGHLIRDAIYWGGDFKALLTLIDTNQIEKEHYKFFFGYAAWSSGQLEAELEDKSWIVYSHTTNTEIFDIDEKKLWQEVLKNLGGKFKMFSNYPVDPNMN